VEREINLLSDNELDSISGGMEAYMTLGDKIITINSTPDPVTGSHVKWAINGNLGQHMGPAP
jgi:bacteriocin-like protein